MKSSKIETTPFFNYTPPVEDAKTLSPFTYYQPFQSSFDPDFSVKTTPRQNAPNVKRRDNGLGERPRGMLHMSGGGFGPRPAAPLKGVFPEASTSSWGDAEGRSLCNPGWRCPRPSFSGEQKRCVSMAGGPGMWLRGTEESMGQFAPKGVVGGLNGASFRTGAAQVAGFDGSLNHSTYYPLMLSPLGKNVTQNIYKTGHSRPMVCNFCKNNKEVPDIYLNHYLYDPETKVLSCPVLRKHVCEICGGTGDQAHTLQYCPVNRERGLQSKVPVLLKTRTITNSTGKIRRN